MWSIWKASAPCSCRLDSRIISHNVPLMFSYIAKFAQHQNLSRPLALESVSAGFPSPAEDHLDGYLDLNRFIDHPSATYFFKLQGDSMYPLMRDGDLLVVDRSLVANDGDVVVAIYDGGLTVKRLRRNQVEAWLEPENPAFPRLQCTEHTEIWGVVLIHMHWPSSNSRKPNDRTL